MQHIAVQKVKHLEAAARQWVQHWLGRELHDDEEVTVMAFPPHPAPDAATRRAAFDQMESVLDKAADNLTDVSDDDFNDAIDEAMNHVRRRRP
jgi:hypothetical protein